MSEQQAVSCLKPEVNCPCPKTECENHSQCCKCITNHRASGKLTVCMAQIAKK
ncbi:hypothetical protein SRRS_34620 [Sporomusa rhizae]